jgi:hypothetical protein
MSPLETIMHYRVTAKLCEGSMVVSGEHFGQIVGIPQ